MAIIKCPECGRQISDKAPVCPYCGVEIAGKIIKCPQCGEIYFRDQEMCPNCHHLTRLSGKVGNTQQPATPRVENTPEPKPQPQFTKPAGGKPAAADKQDWNIPPQPPKKKGHTAIIVGFIIAAIICAVCFYFYNDAKNAKEEDAYEFAMKSDDPLVLQTYLDNNLDAPQEHIQAVTDRLEQLKKQDTDWTNAVVSGSKGALEDYLAKHPDSPHKDEAMHKIDSIDWSDASNENTLEAIQAYLDEHENGEHVDEANTALKALKAKTVQPQEKSMIASVYRHFFQAINAKDAAGLEATVAPQLTNFLGKTDAIKADVVTFMEKIYKADITSMTWRLPGDYKIDKKEVGDEEYQYTVSFSATQDIERTDETKEKHARYRIQSTIGPDGLISSMTMTKILE